jgi:hypothetical protein
MLGYLHSTWIPTFRAMRSLDIKPKGVIFTERYKGELKWKSKIKIHYQKLNKRFL